MVANREGSFSAADVRAWHECALVERQHGVGASQLFNLRRLDREDALIDLSSGESVVHANELAAARAQISSFSACWQEDHGE